MHFSPFLLHLGTEEYDKDTDLDAFTDEELGLTNQKKAAKPVVTAAPKPKKEKPKGGTKESDKLVRRLEREIEKQEKIVAEYDPKIEAASADYQELTRLLEEKEEAELVLMDLMEQWEKAQEG